MHHLFIAFIVFCCVFASAVLGLWLHAMLPGHHLSEDSIGVVKLTTGLIATIAALVLGLLISSAKNSLDTMNAELVRAAASIVQLDRVLAKYGPETQEIREALKQHVGASIQILSSGDPAQVARLGNTATLRRVEGLQHKLEELSPHNAMQRQLQASAIGIADEVLAVRRLALLQSVGALPMALLVMLVVWLSIIFGAFGMFGPFNVTVVAAFFLGAVSTSGAIFLILEMNTPLDGLITVSLEPMRDAFAMLGK
ncbi:conserved membrane hypothetical protein [Paraburkholderia ribeironis]|uniref:DUF4239 domain-containing protein n=1 Tax=Paraburkholderia ribeironis TaxID=1247936 RepID=A0A1N7RSL9_9BURK|nr:hypothetical protein [Paraburkholderia ribeironis]SIT38111.1 conserved membrane hypothetical protein [Paraburkholderia ribeironis]